MYESLTCVRDCAVALSLVHALLTRPCDNLWPFRRCICSYIRVGRAIRATKLWDSVLSPPHACRKRAFRARYGSKSAVKTRLCSPNEFYFLSVPPAGTLTYFPRRYTAWILMLDDPMSDWTYVSARRSVTAMAIFLGTPRIREFYPLRKVAISLRSEIQLSKIYDRSLWTIERGKFPPRVCMEIHCISFAARCSLVYIYAHTRFTNDET